MAYFSNGSEGGDYEQKYCVNCVNWRDRISSVPLNDGLESCPIWDLHYELNYDQCGKTAKAKVIKEILTTLIPRQDNGFAGQCSMFIDKTLTPSDEAEYLEKLRFGNEPTMGFPEKI